MTILSRVALAGLFHLGAAAAPTKLSVRWERNAPSGEVAVIRGELAALTATGGETPSAAAFRFPGTQPGRIDFAVTSTGGPDHPALVTVRNRTRTFTFRVVDVRRDYPIYLPGDGVVVTTGDDPRTFPDIVRDIQARGGQTKLQEIEAAPEDNFAHAAATTRENKVETWLGLGRDDRLFRVDSHLQWIQPRVAGREVKLPETTEQQANYEFELGRGWGVSEKIQRRLDDGVLPILQALVSDETVDYRLTMFASLERQPLTPANVRGTDYLLADLHGHGHMFTPAQNAALDKVQRAEGLPDEETVLYARVVATNRGRAPQFAFVRAPTPTNIPILKPPVWSFDAEAGFGFFPSGRVFMCGTVDGRPLPAGEVSCLLAPGESVTVEFAIPHRPVSRERAAALAKQPFDTRLAEVRKYWQDKLAATAEFHLPETRMNEMVRAGLLHLDLVAYGHPDAPLLPAIGVYTAIGSESSPIIQFMDSMGWHDTAARAIDYFLAKQHDDGFMQNFNGYMLETGAVLWTMGEHYRYTHDDAWLQRVHENVTRACTYLQAWRRRNLQPELINDGYGMLDGKTADPEDPYRSFMLNGYAYLGLVRAAEMYAASSPAESAAWRNEAMELRKDIRAALVSSLENTPVIPLGDGTWSRASAPWTHYRGPVMLHGDGGRWFTHGSITSRDSLLGPLYLVFQEVVDPGEDLATDLLHSHSELMTKQNVAFTQPYYSRHPWVHLRRGETKPFLAAWYNTVSAMADRETYTFTEHLFPVSAHKTHEEAWFLMETRWMLYLEDGSTLRLLSGIPRAYLAPGQEIAVGRASSYFGPVSFRVVASDDKTVRAVIECPGPRHPASVEIRLPHPDGRRAVSVEGGDYLADRETVRIPAFTGRAEVVVHY